MSLFSKRYQLLWVFSIGFIIISFLLRIIFLIWHLSEIEITFFSLFRILFTGLFFDLGVLSFLWVILTFYILIIPQKWVGSLFDKIITYFGLCLALLIFTFTFFAEITFWKEFHCRFNFVAVDYLIYTYEVVKNINESYPLAILIPSIVFIILLILYILKKKEVLKLTFSSKTLLKNRLFVFTLSSIICSFYLLFIKNNQAEWSTNRYNNEISKAGIYSFFSEFRNNVLDYKTFYPKIENKKAFDIICKKLGITYTRNNFNIKRQITDSLKEKKPNVVFILMESMSADFMQNFGNSQKITPFLDSIANKSIFFENLYATGNRTVRGMEAVTLSIPPTPGQSIVKRPKNNNLYTIASVFKAKNYACNFFYGGDGYFDNMNAFYGGNGFTIFDRGRGSILSDDIKTSRININDNEVTFENAWGICDENIFSKMIKIADDSFKKNKPFFNFIMTTSNHRPYTYPNNTIDIPSGTGREGAVKYSDYALNQFFKTAQSKPWFSNTVFVFIADHCASSAGKDEINVHNYHIPAIIYNEKLFQPEKIKTLCSQIDIFPTLFAQLNWSYTSNFFGENVKSNHFEPRALIATYLKLGLLKSNNTVCILSNKGEANVYKWNPKTNELYKMNINKNIKEETIAWYQTADYLYKNNKLN